MELKTFEDIQKYTSKINSKHNERPTNFSGPLFLCSPLKTNKGSILYCYPLKGEIVYCTMAKSESFGKFMFRIDNDSFNKKYPSYLIDTTCAIIDRYMKMTLNMSNKKIFTTLEEANEYVDKIKSGDIKLKNSNIVIETFRIENSKEILDSSFII